jgi:hypothetical protein
MGQEIDAREAVLLVMASRPNMPVSALQVQAAVFMIDVGLHGDPVSKPTLEFGFEASVNGPTSHEVNELLIKLQFTHDIASLLGYNEPTYVALERGYAIGVAALHALSPVRHEGIRDACAYVLKSQTGALLRDFKRYYPEFCTSRTGVTRRHSYAYTGDERFASRIR